jgi:hypothetical protein
MIGAAGDESASSSSRRSEIQQLSIVVELFLQRYFSYETSFYEHILNLLLLCSFMQKIYLIFYLKATLSPDLTLLFTTWWTPFIIVTQPLQNINTELLLPLMLCTCSLKIIHPPFFFQAIHPVSHLFHFKTILSNAVFGPAFGLDSLLTAHIVRPSKWIPILDQADSPANGNLDWTRKNGTSGLTEMDAEISPWQVKTMFFSIYCTHGGM